MANYYLSPASAILQAFTNAGAILAGGSISTYLAGTTTPTNTWTTNVGNVLNSNPITLDSAGRPPSMIWQVQGVAIKAIFKDSGGVQIGPTYDQLTGINDPTAIQLTFYGGTDTGAANAYILTFNAGFSSYTNGLIIYWVPANTNTGASTININGLGAVSIINPDSSALRAGQLSAGQPAVIISQGGSFMLVSSTFALDTFTGTLTGMTGSVTGLCSWRRNNANQVTLVIPAMSGTSNSTAMTLTGVPAAINPSISKEVPITGLTDNSVTGLTGSVVVTTGNVLNFQLGAVVGTRLQNGATNFTAANTKGIAQVSITYPA